MTTCSKQLTFKKWVLFTTYGWFLGIILVIGFALAGELLIKTSDESGGQAAVGIGMGAGVGFMQWMALREYLTTSQRLFWCSFIGFSIAFILRDFITSAFDIPLTVESTVPIAVILGALICGWLQYYFVLKPSMNKSVTWIFYSIAGWLMATLITMSSSMLNLKFAENIPKVLILIFALLLLSIGGPVLGFITGTFIVTKMNTLNQNSGQNLQ
jgi:cytochrome c oxidase subunit IV